MAGLDSDLGSLVDRLPEGWTPALFRGRRYAITKASHAEGRSLSISAVELGGSDLVSANVYRTAGGEVLRPCEMPAAKVLEFLREWTPAD